jgi:hypothetical protein
MGTFDGDSTVSGYAEARMREFLQDREAAAIAAEEAAVHEFETREEQS